MNTDLLFNISQLLKESIGSTRRFTLMTPALVLDDGSSDPDLEETLRALDLEGSVKVTRLKEGVLVQGDVEAQVELLCSRCLEPFLLPLDAQLEEQFHPTVDIGTGQVAKRADGEESDQAFHIDANHQMDLSEPIRQALLVALPMKPLHSEDCAGICPECGANRNIMECGHSQTTSDDRWSGLRELNLTDFPAGENRAN